MAAITTSTASLDLKTSASTQPFRHLARVSDLDRETIGALLDAASKLSGAPLIASAVDRLVVGLGFFQPSTRTRVGFHAAVARLGGTAIPIPDLKPGAGSKETETLEDTVRVVSAYCDALILRLPEASDLDIALRSSSCPVINAGNGFDEHPTQALIDLYAIRKWAGQLDGLRIGLVGDLHWSRCAHSLIRAIAQFAPTEIRMMHPAGRGLPPALRSQVDLPTTEFDDGLHLDGLDVLYIAGLPEATKEGPVDAVTRGKFRLTAETLLALPKAASILCPLPRIDEIDSVVDTAPNAHYFEQSADGLFVRMAALQALLRDPKGG